MTILLALLLSAPIIPLTVREGDVQAFPAMTDLKGVPIGDGRYAQHVEGELLYVDLSYDFPDGRTVDERASIRLQPQVEQKTWDWTEKKGEKTLRHFVIDFDAHKATALKGEEHWEEDVEIEPGKTFAGVGFIYAVKNLRAQMKPGTKTDLRAIAFTPKPRSVGVNLIREGKETLQMGGRPIAADKYTIHVDIPRIVKLFVDAPDNHIWLVWSDPPAYLRFEGSLAEPSDPVVRIDLLAGKSALP